MAAVAAACQYVSARIEAPTEPVLLAAEDDLIHVGQSEPALAGNYPPLQ